MDGSTGAAPVDAFVSTLQRAVSCVTHAVLVRSRSEAEAGFFVGFSERMISMQGRDRLSLSVLHGFELRAAAKDARLGVVRSLGYWY